MIQPPAHRRDASGIRSGVLCESVYWAVPSKVTTLCRSHQTTL